MGYLMRRIGFSALCLVGIVFAVYVGSAYPEEITGRVVGVMDGGHYCSHKDFARWSN